ncbi:hypothetical protein DLAC_02360 [Tieghemostelium lacteum]|uniref:Uncharacterized protein n=1 Tax=Tieghemostelium lacteum TaxID=361077 RepID=A0A152A4S2_TIELA|nr:hypothetical protein DLAC_02360 [Tieghemostelium lacteum]|eukprot:KYR01242.1 hypothetical protein DLAC_02360 [Tieghemostelium lacteum]
MSDNSKPYHLVGVPKAPYSGREMELKEVRERLENCNGVVLESTVSGKLLLHKQYYGEYRDHYEIVFTISDFSYGIYTVENYFQNSPLQAEFKEGLKRFFQTTNRTFLVMISEMSHLSDCDFINRLDQIFPITHISSLKPNQHLLVSRSSGLRDAVKYNMAVYRIGGVDRNTSFKLFRKHLDETKRKFSDSEISQLYSLTNGCPQLINQISKYLNYQQFVDIEVFVELLRPAPQLELYKLLVAKFQQERGFSYQVYSTMLWFHFYEVNLQWLLPVCSIMNLPPVEVQNYFDSMVRYGFYREISKQGYSPHASSMVLLRTLIDRSMAFQNYYALSITGIMQKNSSSVYFFRHIMYYIDAVDSRLLYRDFIDDQLQASLHCTASECYFDIYKLYNKALYHARRSLESIPDSINKSNPLKGNTHKILGSIYSSPYYKDYTQAVHHFRQSIEILDNFYGTQTPFPMKSHIANLVGACYRMMGDHSQSIRYHEDALSYCANDKDIEYQESLYNMGINYFEQKQFDRAVHQFRQSIRACSQNGYSCLKSNIALTKAYIHLNDQKKLYEVLQLIEKSTLEPKETIEFCIKEIQLYKQTIQNSSHNLFYQSKYVVPTTLALSTISIFVLKYLQK